MLYFSLKHLTIFILLFSAISCEISKCNSTNVDQTYIEVEYSTKVVQNEYIVVFNGYYKRTSRANYIKAALSSTDVREKH